MGRYPQDVLAVMNISKTNMQEHIDHDAVRSVSKIVLIAIWIVFVLYLLTLLPGVDRIIPQTAITFEALISAIGTVVLVGLLVFLAPRAANLIRVSSDGPTRVIENLASATYWFVLLVAVLVAHRGFAGVILPYVGGFDWVYDLLFLLVALPAVIFMGARLYASLGPSSELLADKLVGSSQS